MDSLIFLMSYIDTQFGLIKKSDDGGVVYKLKSSTWNIECKPWQWNELHIIIYGPSGKGYHFFFWDTLW